MKINKLFIALSCAALGLTACDDFNDVNTDQSAVNWEEVDAVYFLNQSIKLAQQDPDVAERVVVYNWASAARICGEMSFLNIGRYSDDYNNAYFNQITNWLKYATFAIQRADEIETATLDCQREFWPNLKQIARIWRAVLIAEYSDTFGPYPLEANYQGENPTTYNTVEEVYAYILSELADAAASIDTSVATDETYVNGDQAYGYDPAKWVAFANSLRMRYAMRLSEVDPAKAQSEFEAAVAAGSRITTIADMFAVPEHNGWDGWSGIYTRTWDDQGLSSTMSNILVGLGGIPVAEQRPDLAQYTKPMDYMGMKFDQNYAANTDNPTKQFWMDGIPANIDPRGLEIFCLPNDQAADNFVDKGSVDGHASHVFLDKSGNSISVDAQYTWNYYPAGESSNYSESFSRNQVVGTFYDTGVLLGNDYCASDNERVWFGPWETYFLLAEASLYGWNTGTTAQEAYENGVRSSFEYFGVSQYVDAYLASTDYNRVGTSVNFNHTTEPTNMTVNYVDGYTKAEQTMTYQYPDASRILYKGKKLNDQLTKIITQKYIAQTPYLALEMWNDYRRLGLPFFDMPANESSISGSDMTAWSPTSYQGNQSWEYYPQRLRYPTSMDNADPSGFAQALEKLGGANTTMTPLWWAIH